MNPLNDTRRRAALLTAAFALACTSPHPAFNAKSGAPEYEGAAELPWVTPSSTTDPPAAAASPAPEASLTVPVGAPELTSDGLYVLRDGELELTVDPQHGGRVASFTLDGKSALADAALVPNGASTAFWPSPPGAWGGSVPPELDQEPYGASVEGGTLRLQSDSSVALGLRFEKRYRLDPQRRAVEITYGIFNVGQQPRRVAPWELLRVPVTAGLGFFPSGHETYPQSTLQLDARSPVIWFAYGDNRQPRPVKAYADGRDGWLAHVSGSLLLVRTFRDAEPQSHAPGEAELEILADYDLTTQRHRYVEAGIQGPYAELAPGASSSWAVRWYLRRLPDGVAAKAGNQELVGFVKAVIQ